MELRLRDCPELIDALVIPKTAELEGVQLSKFRDVLFTNTKTLSLERINGDRNLIPEVDKEGLNKLAVLNFDNCSSFEYLIDGTKKNVPNRAFTNLAELSLTSMGGLKMFCNGQSPKDFLQNLQKLTVKWCDELQELFKIDASREEYRAQPLSNLDHYFSLQNLKVVNISECGKLKFLFSPSLIQSLRQLEKLHIKDCAELKTFLAELESVGETESNSHLHPLCLPRLTTLNITRCERLEYVLPVTWAQGLPQLEQLKIKDCAELKTLFAELESVGETESNSHLHSLCLPRLTTLDISKCERLEYVFPITLAQGLPQLESAKVGECSQLKQLFGGLPNKLLASAQSLPRLQLLRLRGLKNLSSFGPENYFITLPALKDLEVVDCPHLTNFSIQQDKALQSKPKLLDEYNSKSRIETIELGGLVWLREIWRCHIPVVALTNLRELEVYDCNSLTYIFPLIHFQNLPQLWSLKIRRCEKVEQIIGDDDTSASSSQSHDQLDETTAVKNEKQVVMFSKLGVLKLESLPNLVSFNPVGYHLIISSLNSLEIQDCPQMITNFTMDSISLVHAQTKAVKAPPLDGTTPSTPDISWREYEPTSLPPYVEEADET